MSFDGIADYERVLSEAERVREEFPEDSVDDVISLATHRVRHSIYTEVFLRFAAGGIEPDEVKRMASEATARLAALGTP